MRAVMLAEFVKGNYVLEKLRDTEAFTHVLSLIIS